MGEEGLMGREEGGMTRVCRQEAACWLPGTHKTNLMIPLEGVKFVYETILEKCINSQS